ncbi:glycosyltransferase [Enterococcus gallinarum]|uniref:glycosyltransferase n=1 Tax=Enterococcus gallinarum TaxID=1353 RepID=UPI000F4F57CA|nr:glycosyltransferase [Enterococcus gallinarum]ROY89983.1 glycosyltransferase [Enterococcus gallinarum]
MKLLYLVYFDINLAPMAGVKKKIFSQIESFEQLGVEIDLLFRSGDKLFLQNRGELKKTFPVERGFSRYKRGIYKVLKKEQLLKEYNYVYIRFPNTIDFNVLSLFKLIGREKTILEVPTYPIDGEFKGQLLDLIKNKNYKEYILKKALFFLHDLLVKNLNVYVKRIVTFMPYEEIWGVKVISIDNGVDVEKYKPLINKKLNTEQLVLTGVANVSKWHGFDRIIYGLAEYYNNKGNDYNIIFNIVGDGPEIDFLKKLVKEKKLKGKVIFHGPKFNNDLIEIYNRTNIAISSIGMHRIGILHGSTIKTKEYCSLGLPFVYGYEEIKISKSFKYALSIDANENPVSIDGIIEFYEGLKNEQFLEEKMHNFAKEEFSWPKQIKKIVDYMADESVEG